jgi:hypothetical protein
MRQAKRLPYSVAWSCRLHQATRPMLSAGDTNYDRRHVLHIDEGIIKLRTGKVGKIDYIIGNLSDSAADFFAGSHVQFDSFSSASLKDASNGRVWLQDGFLLGKQAGTGDPRKNDSEKKCVSFHNELLLRDCQTICEQIITRNGRSLGEAS